MTKPAWRAGRDAAATAENVELLTGQRGDRLDKAVTFRELSALGLANLRKSGSGVFHPIPNPDLGGSNLEGVETPHAPVNVTADGAFHTVLITWDIPNYKGHAEAEVWRAQKDEIGKATMIGTSSANLFADAIGKGAVFFYWVRFINRNNRPGPFQSAEGIRAETSRDVQDILDELQGKIESSHLAQDLLKPIQSVPQLGQSVTEISSKLPTIENAISSLDQRQKDAEGSLKEAQDQLGDASINIGLVQDRLNKKIDKYKGDFDTFRDAVFVVDPDNGNITMDAVNAVREELRTSITEVHMGLDAVSGQINQKADNVVVDKQGSRLTEAEQRINGLDASLSQTVTKGEFTEEQKKVTQIGQELNATKGELAQKATKQEVDSQGERLANAENKLNVQTDELSSQAQRIDALQATVKDGDSTLDARITELAKVTANQDKVIAEQIDGLSVRTDATESSITELNRIVSSSDGVSLDRFDSMQAELDLTAGAAIDGALADDERDKQSRKAFGAIRAEQKVILNEQSAQAQRISDMNVKFEGVNDDTQARISSVEQVLSDENKALVTRIEQVTAEFKSADNNLSSQITTESESRASADQSLSKRIETVTATAGNLGAAVQQQSQAIASLEKGAQAMWTAKAQAGDVKAGIGLVAKSDGTSQVVISASQTFVFDPNNPDALTPLLAIDQGKVIIPEALIKKATIQIIHSEKITADYIKAGVSISAPAISGGSFDMGNAYMSGGAAGFGLGGPYGGWGEGWNSIIYSDGSIYTNRLNAEGGNIRNMRMERCVIGEDCDVRGKLYANKIIGDVVKPMQFGNGYVGPWSRGRIYLGYIDPIPADRLSFASVGLSAGDGRKFEIIVGGRLIFRGEYISAGIVLPSGVGGDFEVYVVNNTNTEYTGIKTMILWCR